MGLEHESVDGKSPRQQFAEAVRNARELRPEGRLSQTELARLLHTSKSTISRLESSDSHISSELPPALDEVFGTDGLFKRLGEEVAAESFPTLYRRRMTLERHATAVWEWSPTVVPGLLQTAGYARAILRMGNKRATEQEISADVGKRLTRQDILRGASPPDLRVVLCQSVLMRKVGGRDVMRDQLASLLTHAERSTTRIQILPLDAEAHLFIDAAASFLTTSSHVTVVCVEGYRTAGIIEDPDHVRAAMRAYDDLTGEALSARASADLIREQLERL